MSTRQSKSSGSVSVLAEVAARLNAARISRSRRPAPFALALMTDPRIENLEKTIAALPEPEGTRAAVIFRHYNVPNRSELAAHLCTLSQAQGHLFLVAGDANLSRECNADGIHLPEWQHTELEPTRKSHPDWIISAACHSAAALQNTEKLGADCALLSPVFPTVSHPGGMVLGLEAFDHLTQETAVPVLALGGINATNAEKLAGTNAAGIAAISALAQTTA